MTEQKDKLKILSFLLQFPDERMIADLSASRDQIEAAFNGSDRNEVDKLVRHLQQTPLLELQENFSNIFDLNSATCLNLTYHEYGDDKKRGQALARFAQAYADAGFAIDHMELPDYLPMVLELVSQAKNRDIQWMLYENQSIISVLAERLAEAESPYAGILKTMAQLLAMPENETIREA